MSLTIYGSARSRTMRVLWMATELHLSFTHHQWEYDDPRLKEPAFLRLNPAGTIPTIVDGDFALSESLAINLYLAQAYGHATLLYPSNPREGADAVRWSLWAQGHIEPWVQKDLLLQKAMVRLGEHRRPIIDRALSIMNDSLGRNGWLVGDQFSVADLNVAGVLSPSRSRELDLTSFRNVGDWLTKCYERPAAVAVRKKFADPPSPLSS